MLFHPSSEHIPFDASLRYFVGIFDIYDREESKGEELHAYNPNNQKDREALILRYCLDPYNEFSHRHKYKLMENLSFALNTENFDFSSFFEDDPDEYSTMAWDETEIADPRGFFADIYRLANEVWKDDLQKASLEDPSTW
ncbi:hypothetical protein IFT96_26085 [Pseudomonas fluorescens]|jgi:hypothetical protein|uniref:Uncharacterized protein n=2 Tax=Pseudomonas TaxID=286 RepID=I4K841_9PSED|nr:MULTISPECIES: hypothetical protein [Pseudomonas]MBD8258852.1 hypothetical protein [Pseudomonas fluorescens]PMZ68556.1 hypothetical protein C1X25_22425 [Pseudomonas sp. GW247-3R2A]EIK60881.1 hypothetical protein PflSS101_2200 [Pseudomonas lactis]KRP82124.1 hypothetical protein TX24_07345 [Pseudomonas lactis]MBJ2321484.1 hypothetical protein [Pseudomonas fluorescens]